MLKMEHTFLLIVTASILATADDLPLSIFVEYSNKSEGSVVLNDIPVLLPEGTLEPLDGSGCDPMSYCGSLLLSGVALISKWFHRGHNYSGPAREFGIAVSSSCVREAAVIQHLLQRYALRLGEESSVTMVSMAAKDEPNIGDNTFYLFPPITELSEDFIVLCKALKWNRIGIIANNYNEISTMLSQHIQRSAKMGRISVSVVLDLVKRSPREQKQSSSFILDALKISGTKIVVVASSFLPLISELLCAASERNMQWPLYAWIVPVHPPTDILLSHLPHDQRTCFEGVIFVRFDTRSQLKTTSQNLLVDAIKIIAKSRNTSMNLTASVGVDLKFSEGNYIRRKVLFVQVRSGKLETQASVRDRVMEKNQWALNRGQNIPSSGLPTRLNTIYPLPLNIVEATASMLSITVVLVLFIYYCKESEVKATSWVLSLLMILGCYLVALNLLTNTLFISTELPPHFNICIFLLWISGYGLPQPLIVAVLLVKMLRVFHLFNFTFNKFGKMSSDYALAFFILLVLSPVVVILTAATAANRYHWESAQEVKNGFTEVHYVCKGDLTVYFQLILAYQIILILVTTIVAWTTRKLRLKHFRDAKKVNLFFLTFLFVAVPGSVLYGVVKANDLQLQAYIIIHLLYNWFIYSCLCMLFLPKLYPIVIRHVKISISNSTKTNKQKQTVICHHVAIKPADKRSS